MRQKRPPTEEKRPFGVHVDSAESPSSSGGEVKVCIKGTLDLTNFADAWTAVLGPVREAKPKVLTIDAHNMDYFDNAGLGLLIQVRRELAGWGGELRLERLKPELQRLVEMAVLDDPAAPQLRPPKRDGFVTAVGRATAGVAGEVYALVAFLGQVVAAIAWSVLHPRRLRWKDLLTTADKVGTDAVPVVCLLGLIIGGILAFQAAPALAKLGGRDFIPTLVAISVVRELGPLIALILMAGRTGSAFAAELGTMKVTEEISALSAMGLEPVRFLAVPRVLAAVIVAPVLGVIGSLTGVLGGYLVMLNYGFTLPRYFTQVHEAIDYKDLLGSEAKTLVFGLIVGGVGCLRGLRTASGPGAVGDSATRSVVAAIVLIIVADGVFGVVYFYLGL